MTNWFRLTPNAKLDREYLRICAVYRCAVRYGATREWCIAKLATKIGADNATRLCEIWSTTEDLRNLRTFERTAARKEGHEPKSRVC